MTKKKKKAHRTRSLKNSFQKFLDRLTKKTKKKKSASRANVRSSPSRKSKRSPARTKRAAPRRTKKAVKKRALSARETRAIKLADNRPMPRVKKRAGHRDRRSTTKYKSRSTVEKKRYSQNLQSTIVFKRNVVEYSKGVKRGKINRFYREQVLGVDAKNFYGAYGISGEPQKFIGRMAYRAKINGKWEKKYMSVSRFKARSEKEFLDGLKNKYSPFGNPGATIAKYAMQHQWDDVEIIGMEFEVIL